MSVFAIRHGETTWSLSGQHTGTTDGCPDGESPDEVGARVDRVIARVRAVAGDVALFAHGHVLRAGRPLARTAPRGGAALPPGYGHL